MTTVDNKCQTCILHLQCIINRMPLIRNLFFFSFFFLLPSSNSSLRLVKFPPLQLYLIKSFGENGFAHKSPSYILTYLISKSARKLVTTFSNLYIYVLHRVFHPVWMNHILCQTILLIPLSQYHVCIKIKFAIYILRGGILSCIFDG